MLIFISTFKYKNKLIIWSDFYCKLILILLLPMQKLKGKGLRLCEKCGNVMIMKIIRRAANPSGTEIEKILQCIVCKHWRKSN